MVNNLKPINHNHFKLKEIKTVDVKLMKLPERFKKFLGKLSLNKNQTKGNSKLINHKIQRFSLY